MSFNPSFSVNLTKDEKPKAFVKMSATYVFVGTWKVLIIPSKILSLTK